MFPVIIVITLSSSFPQALGSATAFDRTATAPPRETPRRDVVARRPNHHAHNHPHHRPHHHADRPGRHSSAPPRVALAPETERDNRLSPRQVSETDDPKNNENNKDKILIYESVSRSTRANFFFSNDPNSKLSG